MWENSEEIEKKALTKRSRGRSPWSKQVYYDDGPGTCGGSFDWWHGPETRDRRRSQKQMSSGKISLCIDMRSSKRRLQWGVGETKKVSPGDTVQTGEWQRMSGTFRCPEVCLYTDGPSETGGGSRVHLSQSVFDKKKAVWRYGDAQNKLEILSRCRKREASAR